MGIVKSYVVATRSSNLRSDEFHHLPDNLAAVAMSSEFGNLLFRAKYSQDVSVIKRLQDEWQRFMKIKAVREGWPIHVKAEAVADAAFFYWLNDRCKFCGGKGYLELKIGELEDDHCPACQGTARKELQCEGRIRRYVEEAVAMLDTMECDAGDSAIKKLADRMKNIF